MAAAPKYKVYDPMGEYVAACKRAEDALMLAGSYGDDATVRLQHRHVVWREGSEEFSATESYDEAREVVWDREDDLERGIA